MKHQVMGLLIAGLCLSAAVQARTWTNAEGKTLEADIVKVKDGKVYLKLAANHKICPLDLGVLSDADQEYIKQYEQDRQEQERAAKLAARRARWEDDYDDVKEEAEKYGLPIFLLYTAPEWCGYCVKLEEHILSQKAFEEYANGNLVLFVADFSESRDKERWEDKYPELIKNFPVGGYPCAYLISASGKKLGKIGGYDSGWSVQDYIAKLENFKKSDK